MDVLLVEIIHWYSCCPCSYKEEEDGETDPDEVIEAAGWADPSDDDPNRNVIEKVCWGKIF
jgi:hypothetical protein